MQLTSDWREGAEGLPVVVEARSAYRVCCRRRRPTERGWRVMGHRGGGQGVHVGGGEARRPPGVGRAVGQQAFRLRSAEV
eukprot:2451631-Prymnesium_polylepis.1